MVLFFVGLGIATMALYNSDPQNAGAASVVLGVVAFFCIVGILTHVIMGAALRVGGAFLSDALGKAANNGGELDCDNPESDDPGAEARAKILCTCMDKLVDIIKGLGTASLVVAASYLFSTIVSISASSGLASSKKEMHATKLNDSNQVQIQGIVSSRE